MSSRFQKVITADASSTLYDSTLEAHYRSSHGAQTESAYVFLEGCRLSSLKKNPIRVLEFGFGTGMNFRTTAAFCITNGLALEYHAVEHAPLDPSLIEGSDEVLVNFTREILTRSLHEKNVELSHSAVTLHLYFTDYKDAIIPVKVDAVYHDPFGPMVNPDAWSVDAFRWAFQHLDDQGLLATYGAAGHARRAMASAGFFVAKRPGASGKREMTVAGKSKDIVSLAGRIKLAPIKDEPS